MLKLLRKKGVMKKLLWVLAVVIIISFGFFGTANYMNQSRRTTHAGRIFGRKISFKEFENSFIHARNQAILRYGEDFFKIREQIDLESETWDRLILLHETKKRKIKVDDKEIVEAIASMEFFKREERFDQEIYDKILRYVFRCRPRNFEEGIRENIAFAKLFEKETASVSVTDKDVLEDYKNKNEKARVSYILFSPNDYKDKVSLDSSEIREYYEQQKESFRVPPKINVEYINIDLPDEDDEEEKAKIENRMLRIYEELQKDPDFKRISQKNQLTLNESGFFSRERPNLKLGFSYQLLQRVFELKEGQFSEPIETSEGYYILRIKEVRDTYIPEFKEAQAKVKGAINLFKAKQLAKDKSEDYAQKIQERLESDPKTTFDNAAGDFDLTVEQTPLFIRNQYIPKIGLAKEFQETAFSLRGPREVSIAIETPKGYCILHLEEFVPIDEEEFKAQREKSREILLAQRKAEAFGKFILQLRFKANLENNISNLGAAN